MRRHQHSPWARLVTLSVFCLMTSTAGLSPAAEPAQYEPVLMKKAKAHVDVARVAYNLGKFDEALRGYEAAYRLVPMPALLFNIAQCYRHAGDHERAVFFFDGYLREAEPGADQRALTEELKRESQKKLAAEPVDKTPSPTPPIVALPRAVPAGAPVAAPPPPVPEGPAVVSPQIEGPAPEEASVGPHQRWWFWVIVGVGAAAAGTAAVVALSPGSQDSLPSGSLGTVDWR